jgi:D-glycero-alpha-D-manno-heptose 1-phosphate guanylyltransferase
MTTAIILAGGLGTRLSAVVADVPKPMAPVAGRPFLAHQMDHWIGQKIDRFVLSVGYRAVAISNHFGDRYRGVPVEYAVEPVPLGTGGALVLAAAKLRSSEPALLLNGDTYFDVDLAALTAHAERHDADWTLALFRHDDPARYMGVALSADGRITALRSVDAPHANGGAYWFRPGALAAAALTPGQAASLEDEVLPRLLDQGQRFAGLVCDGDFIDIGVPRDYLRAASVLPARLATEARHAVHG